jgi:phage gp29-like protein
MANDLIPFEPAPPPRLVDNRGRPLTRPEVLEADIAGASIMGGRSIQTGRPADGLTPERLARILRQAENGDATAYYELAEQMEEKDLHYLGVLGTRKRQVAQLPINVEAASDDGEDEADAQLVRDFIERDTLEAEIFDMLDAVGKGVSATEMIWDTHVQPWEIVRLENRDLRWFEFDKNDGRTLLLRDAGQLKPLDAGKYIITQIQAKTGLPVRGGLARPVAWAYMFRNYSFKDWARFNEAYGMPLRIAKYEGGTDDANVRKMLRALIGMSADFAAAFPKSADVEFIKGEMGGSGNLFKDLAEYFERQISKAVLGQTGTTDTAPGGLGSGAQASTHKEVSEDIERADAKALAAALNAQLVRPLIIFNRGVRKRYPRIKIGRPDEEDVEAFRASVEQGVKLGVPIAVSTWRKGTGIDEPKAGEVLLQAPAVPAPVPDPDDPEKSPPGNKPGPGGAASGRKTAATGFLGPLKGATGPISIVIAASDPGAGGDRDEIDDAADAAAGDWLKLMTPIIAPIAALADQAGSLEELRDQLAAAAAGMDVDQLVQALAEGTFAARLTGDVDVAASQEEG